MNDRPSHTAYAKDGREIRIRALGPSDAKYLVDLFEHMGPESRYLRFNLALTNPDQDLVWSEAERLAQVDPQRDGAWLVFADLPGEPNVAVGGVRYIRINDHLAEASLAVRDDMQNNGIGSALLNFMVRQARKAGITSLTATIQRANRPIWRLLKKSGLPFAFTSEAGYTNITVDLTELELIP